MGLAEMAPKQDCVHTQTSPSGKPMTATGGTWNLWFFASFEQLGKIHPQLNPDV